jgi:hypothetical protein
MSKIRLVLLSLLAVLAMSAVASASASAVMPAFTHPDGSLITGSLKVLSTHLGTSVLKMTVAGVAMEIQCTGFHGTGTLENSATKGDGLGLALVHYLECSVTAPAGQGCLVQNHLVHVHSHVLLLLSATPGLYNADFTPESGATFASITIEKCTNTGLNNTFKVNGFAEAMVNNTTLELEFTNTSGSKLTFGGNPAEYLDTVKPEMENSNGAADGGIMVENGS